MGLRISRSGEMGQRVRVLATKPDDLRLMPKTDMIEGEN